MKRAVKWVDKMYLTNGSVILPKTSAILQYVVSGVSRAISDCFYVLDVLLDVAVAAISSDLDGDLDQAVVAPVLAPRVLNNPVGFACLGNDVLAWFEVARCGFSPVTRRDYLVGVWCGFSPVGSLDFDVVALCGFSPVTSLGFLVAALCGFGPVTS